MVILDRKCSSLSWALFVARHWCATTMKRSEAWGGKTPPRAWPKWPTDVSSLSGLCPPLPADLHLTSLIALFCLSS
jgi:hypothetical protein